MVKWDETIFDKGIKPFTIAKYAVGFGVGLMGVGKLLQLNSGDLVGTRFPWLVAAAFLLCFALFNSVFSLSSKTPGKYWGQSMYSFIGVAVVLGGAAWLFSGLSIFDAGSYPWIFVVVTIGYLIFMGMVNIMRNIVQFAQKEEWNAPRTRDKKRN